MVAWVCEVALVRLYFELRDLLELSSDDHNVVFLAARGRISDRFGCDESADCFVFSGRGALAELGRRVALSQFQCAVRADLPYQLLLAGWRAPPSAVVVGTGPEAYLRLKGGLLHGCRGSCSRGFVFGLFQLAEGNFKCLWRLAVKFEFCRVGACGLILRGVAGGRVEGEGAD